MKLLVRLLKNAGKLNFILCASILSGTVATFLQLGIILLGFISLLHSFQYFPWFLIILLAVIGGFCRFGEQYLGHLVAFKILSKFRNLTYRKVIQLAPAKLDHHHSSDLLKVIAQDIEQIEIFYAHTLSPVVIGLIVSVIQAVYFWTIQPLIGIIALISYVIVGAMLPLFNQQLLKKTAVQLNRVDAEHQRLAAETVTGKFELQQYQRDQEQLNKLDQAANDYWRVNRRKTMRQDQQGMLMQLVLVLGTVAVLLVSLLTQVSLVWVLLFPFTFSRVLALGSLPGSLSGGLVAAHHLFDLFDEHSAIDDSGVSKIGSIQQIHLNQVQFTYPERLNDTILQDINLSIKDGERIGIIGPSGEGKSTIVKLIMRWYESQKGTITINENQITDLKLFELRSQINYVPQNARIFEGSIRENLSLRDEQVTDEKMWQVLKWVHLNTTIKQLPDQLNTKISSSQELLSAGEAQRLELARALLHDGSLLILDEPTSNLDVLNEALILNAVKQHYDGTVVIVTHRRSSLAICDRVLQLNNGRLKDMTKSSLKTQTVL